MNAFEATSAEELVPASELLRSLATAGLLASGLATATCEKAPHVNPFQLIVIIYNNI